MTMCSEKKRENKSTIYNKKSTIYNKRSTIYNKKSTIYNNKSTISYVFDSNLNWR